MTALRCICYLLFIFLNTYAVADITLNIVKDEIIYVETDNYAVRFAYGGITYLHNKLTNETYTLPIEPIFERSAAIIGRNEIFWARRFHTVETHKINSHTVETRFREDGNEIRLVIAVDPNTNDLLISGDCASNTPGVSAIQWGISSLDLTTLRVIVPSQGKPLIDSASGIKRSVFRYPTPSWGAQLAIIQSELGGLYLRSKDTTSQYKDLYYRSYEHEWYGDEFGFRIITYNQAPWDTLTTAKSVTWRLNTYTGDWCVPAQIYRDWMEQAFNPWRLSDVDPWVSNINLVVVNDSLNTEILKPLAESVDPTKTLLYLTTWRKQGRNVSYPDYGEPREGFDSFLETARQYGFRVMPHVSLYDCSPSHPLYAEFKKYQYRSPETGELLGWAWDDIGSRVRNAHISLASSKWRNLLVQQFKALWEKYNIDAFFLDVSHFVLNDANGLIEGLTSAEGNVLMHLELAEAMPGVAFSGEFVHELTFFRENFAKYTLPSGPPHPISTFLFSPYTRFHFGGIIPLASHPEYQTYRNHAETQGYLHTLRINNTEMLNEPLVQDTLSVVRQWQILGLQPNIDCDWGTNTLFQYTTQTGETVTHNGSVLVMTNPDLNRDGVVNVLDLILIVNKLGQQVPQATPGDLNGDGVINILDLILVAQNITDAP